MAATVAHPEPKRAVASTNDLRYDSRDFCERMVVLEGYSMAKNHGARQQKKVAKQKAKRAQKRTQAQRRDSRDPTIRLARADKWPVYRALVGKDLWKDGIGYLVIARQEAEGQLIIANYLVDVYCLGVKNAFWDARTPSQFQDMLARMEETQTMVPIAPAALVKILQGAVEYANTYGFRPHPDYRHAEMVLKGIDPSTCTEEFTYGRDGKPFYIRGPNESPVEAMAISKRIEAAGGHFVAGFPDSELQDLDDADDEYDPDSDDDLYEDDEYEFENDDDGPFRRKG
jgi:hypothetical protein